MMRLSEQRDVLLLSVMQHDLHPGKEIWWKGLGMLKVAKPKRWTQGYAPLFVQREFEFRVSVGDEHVPHGMCCLFPIAGCGLQEEGVSIRRAQWRALTAKGYGTLQYASSGDPQEGFDTKVLAVIGLHWTWHKLLYLFRSSESSCVFLQENLKKVRPWVSE